MSKSIFSAPHFNDEAAAYAFVEAQLWADGRVCPHCGVVERSAPLKGKCNRIGLYKCYACRKPFTVKVGTIFEASHIAMRDWLAAIHLICSSKKGISANQLHRTLGYHPQDRVVHGASHPRGDCRPSVRHLPMGGEGGFVEADETFIGRKADATKRGGAGHKNAVVALVERGGRARSFYMPMLRKRDMHDVIKHYVSPKAHLRTDESRLY